MSAQETAPGKGKPSQVVKVTGMSEELLRLLDARVKQQQATGRAEYIRELIRRDTLAAGPRPRHARRPKTRRRAETEAEQSLPAGSGREGQKREKQNLLTRFMEFVGQDVLQQGVAASRIEVRDSFDPEDDTTQSVVHLWVRGMTDTEIRRYHQELGARADHWAARLSETSGRNLLHA